MIEVIKLENSIFKKNSFDEHFKVMSQHHGDIHISHTEKLSKDILCVCDTIIVVKNENQIWDSEKFKSWKELCKRFDRYDKVKEIINEGDSSYSLKNIISEKSGDDIFYFAFYSREIVNEFIKYLTDDSMDLLIYSTTDYSNVFLINQFLTRELKLNN